jgi:hypothetical protein
MAPPFAFTFARAQPIFLYTASGEIDTDTLSAISIYSGGGLVKGDGSEGLREKSIRRHRRGEAGVKGPEGGKRPSPSPTGEPKAVLSLAGFHP